MRIIPCDPNLERLFLGSRPQIRDGAIVTNDDNDQVMIVSVLGMPTDEERAEVFEVKVPSRGIPSNCRTVPRSVSRTDGSTLGHRWAVWRFVQRKCPRTAES